jgi:hypothetical protein
MRIFGWALALPNIDFGYWEPCALALRISNVFPGKFTYDSRNKILDVIYIFLLSIRTRVNMVS